MGWLPSAPQLNRNPLEIAREAAAAGRDPAEYVVEQLRAKTLRMACEDPDAPENWPRNMFIWRSNLLGASGKGHEYFLKHLLGTDDSVQGPDLGTQGSQRVEEVVWHDEAPRGKLDLLVTLDFRMSSTCLYSDIVLPTATWYEKDDLNTSDMHPFIHPLSEAVDPAWESRSDWDIFKGIAGAFSQVAQGRLGVEQDLVTLPLLHDTPGELGQPFDAAEWYRDECDPIPGRTMPDIKQVERDYPATYARFTSVGPLLEKLGNGSKGINLGHGRGSRRAGRPAPPAIRRRPAASGHRDPGLRHGDVAGAGNPRQRSHESLGSARESHRPRSTATWQPPRPASISSSATSSPSRARSSAPRPGRGSSPSTCRITPAGPT